MTDLYFFNFQKCSYKGIPPHVNLCSDMDEIETLKLDHSFVCAKYELTIEQHKAMHALDMSQLKTKITFDKDKEIEKLNVELSSKNEEIERLNVKLLSEMAELDKLKIEVSSVKFTLQKDASQKEKEQLRELSEKLLTWPYKKLIINAEDLIEDIYFIVHTNALESAYLDLETQVEVLQRKVKTQKQTIRRLKQSHVTKDVLVDTKTEQITEHASTSKSTDIVCTVKPSPFTVLMK